MKEVKVVVGKKSLDGLHYKNSILVDGNIKLTEVTHVEVDGVTHSILSWTKHPIDNLISIKLANASKSKEKKSDDNKQTKG